MSTRLLRFLLLLVCSPVIFMCFLLVRRSFRLDRDPSVVGPTVEKSEIIVVSLESVIFRRVAFGFLAFRFT